MTSAAHKLIERRVIAYHNVRAAMRCKRYWFFNRRRHHEAMRLMLLAREKRRRNTGIDHTIGLSRRIVQATADVLGILAVDILRNGRQRTYVEARWIAAWMMYRLTRNSSTEIGRRLGGRDHSTVLHGIAVVRDDLSSGGKVFGEIVAHVERRLGLK